MTHFLESRGKLGDACQVAQKLGLENALGLEMSVGTCGSRGEPDTHSTHHLLRSLLAIHQHPVMASKGRAHKKNDTKKFRVRET